MNRIITFLKNWTLPVSMAFGTIIYLVFAYTPQLDEVGNFMAPIFGDTLPFLTFMVLFVTFCKVDFKQMKLAGWQFWICFTQVLLVLVIVGIILLYANDGTPKVLWEGILSCVICPTAAAAAVVTVKLGGNLGTMTTYTFISNFITALVIPTFLPLIEKDADITFISAFLMILNKVMLILVAPLLLGWFVRHYMHRLHDRIMDIPDLGFYLWGVSLAIVTGTTVKNIMHANTTIVILLTIAVTSMLICLAQFAIGKYIGHFSHSSINTGQAMGQKNTVFAIWISFTYMNPLSSVGPGCYILWQNIINSWELWVKRKHDEEGKNC